MSQPFKSLAEFSKHFSNEKKCMEYFTKLKWIEKPKCPHCKDDKKAYILNDGRYKCSNCKKKFSAIIGSVFTDKHIPMTKWFMAIHLITSHPKGVSSIQLSKGIGVTQKTAWLMLHKIREFIEKKKTPLMAGEVEIDEVYIGGKSKNKHAFKKAQLAEVHENLKKKKESSSKKKSSKKKKTSDENKSLETLSPVVGLFERNSGELRCFTLQNTTSEVLLKTIKTNVVMGTMLYTDDNTAYCFSDNYYQRQYTNHTNEEYVVNRCHTNNIERVWGLFKRGFVGTYHSMSNKHLDRYLAEFTFRIQYRKLSQQQRFDLVLKRLSDGSITMKEIQQFNMYRHNYSGRGPMYPLELLRKTKKRGRLSDKRTVELKEKSRYSYSNMRKNKETFENQYKDYDIEIALGKIERPVLPKESFIEPPIIPTIHEGRKFGRPLGVKNRPKDMILKEREEAAKRKELTEAKKKEIRNKKYRNQ